MSTGVELHVAVPGPLGQRTGGYIYDARVVDGLRRLGWHVVVHELEGAFPDADAAARAALARTLGAVPAGGRVVIDGLAMGGLPEVVGEHAGRLRAVALVHHPLADETGIAPDEQARLTDSEARALAAARGVIVTSAFTSRRVAAMGVPEERVRVVPPGTEHAPRAEGPAPGEPPRLLCVGAVIPRKGHDVLVRALARVSGTPWTCVCAGSTSRAPAFAQHVLNTLARLGLDDRVAFPGECDADSLAALYHGSSIFVLPSHYEGYGMAFAEALARGLPVIGTTGGAVPFTVPADAARLVPPGDETALASALREVLDRPARRAELAGAARRHAASLPSWDDAAAAFEKAVVSLTCGE